MFVLVSGRYVNLADAARRIVPAHLGQGADIQPPIPGDPVYPRHVRGHAELARKGIAEAVEKDEEPVRSDELLERPAEGRHHEPRHASMHPVRHPAVETLAEHIIEVWIRHGVAESAEEFPVVADDVAVVERDDVGLARGEHVPVGEPAGPAFPVLSDIEAVPLERIVYLPYAFSLVVNDF